jgi:hypothetical protein
VTERGAAADALPMRAGNSAVTRARDTNKARPRKLLWRRAKLACMRFLQEMRGARLKEPCNRTYSTALFTTLMIETRL